MPEVVFLPGFMQHADSWSPVAAAVGERYPVRILDFQTWSFAERLDEIAAAAAGAVVVGYSMGGRLALYAALRDPGAFDGLVTIGSAPGIEDPDERRRRRAADEELAAWIESHPMDEVAARWERNPVFASQSPKLVEAQRPGRLDHAPPALAKLLRSAGQAAQDPVWDQLATLTTPILALAGETDDTYRAAANRIGQLAPNAESAVVEGAGHAAHLEQPERTAKQILGWLHRPGT